MTRYISSRSTASRKSFAALFRFCARPSVVPGLTNHAFALQHHFLCAHRPGRGLLSKPTRIRRSRRAREARYPGDMAKAR